MNKDQRQVKEHYPDLDYRGAPPVCAECRDEWPCAPVRVAWDIPTNLNMAEARDYLVKHLGGVS